ncbi:MAG TPA: PAS domain-containing protein [Gaiellaceae bacterium]|nr:PAS domain-containing protein [Gaiellaceae bacterium]
MTSDDATRIAQLAILGEAAECLVDVAIFVWDDDRNYVAVNDVAVDLVGRSREEILRMKVGDMTTNRASPLFEEVQRVGVHRGTSQILRADGTIEIEWLTCRTRVGGLPYMVSICWRVAS